MLWTSIISYGGVALLALLAAWMFSVPGNAVSAWCLVFGGIVLAAAGLRAQSALRHQQQSILERQAQVETLQAQLQHQRSSVDALADGLDVAIFICDPRGSILYANRRAMELFKFDNPVGRSILAITLSYDLEQLVLSAARSKEPQNAELNFSYPTDRVGMAKAWPAEELSAERVFVSIYEITDLRRLERVRQDFVSNVSHELRTPLTIIRSMAETLQDDDQPDPALMDRYLTKIVSEVDRLSMIANDLLILSAAESNPVRKQACDIADVFRTVTQQLEKKALEKGLTVGYEGPEHLQIQANSSQMTQVALNLVDNALNYTPQGGVLVQVEPTKGDEVVVHVRDTGIGISSEHLPRIFERFYRIDKARSRSSGGTGLGLSIVKHIVEAHGGKVSVESGLNEGSTFTVRLPIGDLTPSSNQDGQ